MIMETCIQFYLCRVVSPIKYLTLALCKLNRKINFLSVHHDELNIIDNPLLIYIRSDEKNSPQFFINICNCFCHVCSSCSILLQEFLFLFI